MNVEIGTEAVEFPEKEYINGIIVAVHNVLECQQFFNSVKTLMRGGVFKTPFKKCRNLCWLLLCTRNISSVGISHQYF
jgi:hypothetical protein